MRPLLIGQAPGPNTRSDKPLFPYPSTSAGGRLQQMTGLTRGQYLRTFDRMNLLQHFPGSVQNGDSFPLSKARPAAQAVEQVLGGRRVVLVGRNVATAFGFRESPFFEWFDQPIWGYEAVVVPHPSGRNHWYNNEENRALARCWWAEFVLSLQIQAEPGIVNIASRKGA